LRCDGDGGGGGCGCGLVVLMLVVVVVWGGFGVVGGFWLVVDLWWAWWSMRFARSKADL